MLKNKSLRLFLLLLSTFFIGLGYSLYPDIKEGNINPIKQVSAMFEKKEEIHYVEVEPIVTNLKQGKSKKQNYISLHIAFEVLGNNDLDIVKKKEPVVRDAMIDFLGDQTMAELVLRDGKELNTKEYIVDSLQLLINEKLDMDKEAVRNILITDMFLQ